jgi:hypothetical protein
LGFGDQALHGADDIRGGRPSGEDIDDQRAVDACRGGDAIVRDMEFLGIPLESG